MTTNVCMHVCTHDYTHVCMQVCTHGYTHAYMYVFTHGYAHAYVHICTHGYQHVCMHVCTHGYAHVGTPGPHSTHVMPACVHVSMHAHRRALDWTLLSASVFCPCSQVQAMRWARLLDDAVPS